MEVFGACDFLGYNDFGAEWDSTDLLAILSSSWPSKLFVYTVTGLGWI